MSAELEELKNTLQIERQQLAERLNVIDDKLSKINAVWEMLKEKHIKVDTSQMPLLNIEPVSDRLSGLPFNKAVDTILKDNPERWWSPKEIFERLLQEGYKSDASDFTNTARNMLSLMRKKGKINVTKTKRGFLHSYKVEDSVPHMVETESNVDNGELPEQVKGTDL